MRHSSRAHDLHCGLGRLLLVNVVNSDSHVYIKDVGCHIYNVNCPILLLLGGKGRTYLLFCGDSQYQCLLENIGQLLYLSDF